MCEHSMFGPLKCYPPKKEGERVTFRFTGECPTCDVCGKDGAIDFTLWLTCTACRNDTPEQNRAALGAVIRTQGITAYGPMTFQRIAHAIMDHLMRVDFKAIAGPAPIPTIATMIPRGCA